MRRTHALVLTTALGLALTACSSGDGDVAADPAAGDQSAPAAAEASAVTYTATDTITWESPDQEATAGSIDLTLVCSPSVEHQLAIEGVEGDAALLSCAPGEQATGSVDLTAGDYVVFCSVPGHREAGMEGTLRVS